VTGLLLVSTLVASHTVAERFTSEELEELQQRATELALEQESDASMRTALQLLGEAAANLGAKIPPE